MCPEGQGVNCVPPDLYSLLLLHKPVAGSRARGGFCSTHLHASPSQCFILPSLDSQARGSHRFSFVRLQVPGACFTNNIHDVVQIAAGQILPAGAFTGQETVKMNVEEVTSRNMEYPWAQRLVRHAQSFGNQTLPSTTRARPWCRRRSTRTSCSTTAHNAQVKPSPLQSTVQRIRQVKIKIYPNEGHSTERTG